MAVTTITKVGAFDNDLASQINANFASLSASTAGGTLADGKILAGNGANVATAVTPSGDVEMDNAGAFTVTGVNGAAITADGGEIDDAVTIIAALPTANVASPAIWNDAGVLKVGTL